MLAITLMFGGAFTAFTYFRPFLEHRAHVDTHQLSWLLLALGIAGFVGASGASAVVGRRLFSLLCAVPLMLAVTTAGLVAAAPNLVAIAAFLFAWGALNAAYPLTWSTLLARFVADEPDSGGGLQVAVIQLSILLSASFGGMLIDAISDSAPLLGGAVILVGAGVIVGNGARLRP